MWTCEKVQDMFSEYLDNQLTEIELANFQKHIENCRKCKEELFLLQNILCNCRQVDEQELPENFRQKLHERLLETKQAQKKKNPPWYMNWKMYSGIAAGLLIIAVFRTHVFEMALRPEKAYVNDIQLNHIEDGNHEDSNLSESIDKSSSPEQNVGDTGSETVKPDNGAETNNDIPKERKINKTEKSKTEQKKKFSDSVEKSQRIQKTDNGTIADASAESMSKSAKTEKAEVKESMPTEFQSTDTDSIESYSLATAMADVGEIKAESNQENAEISVHSRSLESNEDSLLMFSAKSFTVSEQPKIAYITKITATKNDMKPMVEKLKEVVPNYGDRVEFLEHRVTLRLTLDEYEVVMDHLNEFQADIQTEIIDKEEEYNRLVEQRNSAQQKIGEIEQVIQSMNKEVKSDDYEQQLKDLEGELETIESKIAQIIELTLESILTIEFQDGF